MFKTQEKFTNSFFGNYAYQPILSRHSDHLLIRMNALINWSFVEKETIDRYSEKGQHAYHPLVIFKLLIIQNLYALSERAVCEQADVNILYRSFVGLGLNEEMPHFTELGKFKERVGNEKFEALFYQVLKEAERLGIDIGNKRTADASSIDANVDVARCAKDKQDDNDKSWVDRNTSDADARFGRKGNAPNSKRWYGYKSHINEDAQTELVMAVKTTDASVTDESMFVGLIDKERNARGNTAIRKQGGDKGYVGHQKDLEERRILDYTIPRDNMKKEKEQKAHNTHYLNLKHQRYKVERKFAEGKKFHHLRKARYWGLFKVHLQCLLTYLVINLKRITNLTSPIPA